MAIRQVTLRVANMRRAPGIPFARPVLARLLIALLLALPLAGGLASGAGAAPQEVGPSRVYFPVTGHFLSNAFLDYWRQHGAIPIIGYPLTEELADQASGLTVQYFERAVFEWHGDAPDGFKVQLRRLGATTTAGRTDAAFRPTNGVSDASCNAYKETGHSLCNGFRTYWNDNGGLAIFGFPISGEFQEKNPDTGQVYTVQYFERARFEYHPEFKGTRYEVELGRLGDAAAKLSRVSTASVPNNDGWPSYDPSLWYVPAPPAPASPADVRVPPEGAPSNLAKWIEVDLSNQYLRAWEGSTKVFGQYISSGIARYPTPTGTFRIFTKLDADDMTNGIAAPPGEYYYLPAVPWVMYFADGGYALHGTYWHRNFGTPMSHGCVNMTVDGARWVYNWAPLGTTVWIH